MTQAPETDVPFFRTGSYAPVADELTTFDLPVDGAIPPQLSGWYLRNGPNPRQSTDHWFTGDGMIHGVRLENGRAAWYRNRWVRTESFDHPAPLYNPDGSRNLHRGPANTHVIRHAGRTLALVESSLPYEITNELETLGVYNFGGKLVDSMTAHPKICPTTGELHFFGYGSLTRPHMTYYRADASGELTISRGVDVPALTMMHDMALTAKHVIFMDLPIVFNLDVAIKGKRDMPYRWDDNYGARLGVLRRDDPFGEIRWFDIDPCYVFHVANAYDAQGADGSSIVLDAVRYPEMWRDNAHWHTNNGFSADGVMWRWTIDLERGTVDEQQIDDRGVEFPRIDDRRTGLPARYVITVGSQGGVAPVPRSSNLIRYDRDRGTAELHRFENDRTAAPGEAVFVPADSGGDEAAGWYLTYVYDPARDGSDLVIVDASDFEGEPVARVRLPQRVPHGFHGNWVAD
jgi:carotenoid cleavage dioxygenase-like enzyme